MRTLDDYKTDVWNRVSSVVGQLPDDVRLSFILEDHDERGWVFHCQKNVVTICSKDAFGIDCEFRCTSDIFAQILSGVLDPMRAFYDGTLRLEGDVGLALSLRHAFAA